MIATHENVLSESRPEEYEERNESTTEISPSEDNLLVTDYAYPMHPLHVPPLMPRAMPPPTEPMMNRSVAGSEVELARRLGVRFDSSNAAWVARWIEPHSEKKKSRWFSVAKYGELSARRLAIQACLYNMKPSDCPILRDLQDVLSSFSAAQGPPAPTFSPDGTPWSGFVPSHHVLVQPPTNSASPDASSNSISQPNYQNNSYMASLANNALLNMTSMPQLDSICQGVPQHQAAPGFVVTNPASSSELPNSENQSDIENIHSLHQMHPNMSLENDNIVSPSNVEQCILETNNEVSASSVTKSEDVINEKKPQQSQLNMYNDWNAAYSMSQQQTPPSEYGEVKIKTPSTAESYYVDNNNTDIIQTNSNFDLPNRSFLQQPKLSNNNMENSVNVNSAQPAYSHLENSLNMSTANLFDVKQDNADEADDDDDDDEAYDENYRPSSKTEDDDFYSEDADRPSKKRKMESIDVSSDNMLLNGGVGNGVVPAPLFPGFLGNNNFGVSPYYQLYQPFGPQQAAADGFAFLNPYQIPLMPHNLHPHHAAFFSQLQPLELSTGSSGHSGGVVHGMSAKMTCERGLHYSRCYHGNKECWIAVWNTKGGRIMHEAFDVQAHGFEQAKLKAREARDAAHSNNIAVAENSRPSWKSHSNTGIPHVSLDSQQLRFRAHKFGRRLCRSFSFGRRRGSFASRESAFDAAVLWLIQTPTEEEIAAVSGVSTKLEEAI